MKNIIILVILGIGGYFAYQYFGIPWLKDSAADKPIFNASLLPEQCQRQGETLKRAFDGNKRGEVKTIDLREYSKQFRRCLSQAGYDRAEIDEAYNSIKNSR